MRQEYVQLERICPGCVEELVRNGRIYQYHFHVEAKRGKILELFAVTAYGICVIWSSLQHSWRNRELLPKKEIEGKKSCSLCCRKNGRVLSCKSETESETLEDFLMERGLREYQTIAWEAKKTGSEMAVYKISEKF